MSARVNVASASASSGSSLAIGATSHTAGNLLVVLLGWETDGNLTSVTDTAGNTYTLLTQNPTQPPSTHDTNSRIAYAWNCLGHASNIVTANFANSPVFIRMAVLQISGILVTADPNDDDVADKDNTTGGTTFDAGDLVTNQVNEYLVFGAKGFASQTFTPTDAGWTEVIEIPNEFVVNESFVTSTGTYPARATASTGSFWAASAAAFKDALPISREQTHYRLYADGTESGATALAAEDTKPSVNKLTPFQLRIQTLTQNADPPSETVRFEYRPVLDGDWLPIPKS